MADIPSWSMKTAPRGDLIGRFAGAALIVAGIVSLAASPAAGQAEKGHLHADGDTHREVHFPVTCKPAVQSSFDRAVAVLHSYGYQDARRGFLTVAEQDPACGMAWWGVAMTYYHATWPQPMPDPAAGRAAARKAATLGAATERERAYIAAVGTLFRDQGSVDHRTRALAYSAAMQRLAAEYPADIEASIFSAVSLLGAAPPADTTHAYQKQAADILNRLATEHPHHPGIVHYTIHAFDHPGLAELALPAARIYAELAPDVPHALHMPSHIFTRLGLWQESIASNLETARAAEAQTARLDSGVVAFEYLHAHDYLVYAYLQLGQDRKAREALERMARATRFDAPNLIAAHALLAAPARSALERRDWKAAAALEPPEVDLPWGWFPYVRGITRYANGIGAARAGDAARARRAVAELERLHAAVAASPPGGPYDWAGWVEAMRLAAAGWVAFAEGDEARAVHRLTEAADLEETVGKHAVTPGPLLPAREQLGDLLLELGRASEALAAYQAALADSPKRLNALAGAGRAAELVGDRSRARTYYEELVALCRSPSCERPVAQQAAAFVGER